MRVRRISDAKKAAEKGNSSAMDVYFLFLLNVEVSEFWFCFPEFVRKIDLVLTKPVAWSEKK